jgi:hypothetical protein
MKHTTVPDALSGVERVQNYDDAEFWSSFCLFYLLATFLVTFRGQMNNMIHTFL